MSDREKIPATPAGASLFDRLSERQMVAVVLLLGAVLYLPFAGSYGLWDPWETHYGEVARQMTARGDYISLWWPGSPLDGEAFWSKPVLTFWLMSLAMHVAGIGGRGAPPGEMALSSAPEWALRVPFCLMALLALAGVYLAVARFVGRRAGVLSVVALATFPMFSLIARQAMTDMAFIGPMTLALCLGALALFDQDDRELPRRRWRRLAWPHHGLFYATVALFGVVALPQLVVDSIQVRWRVFPGSDRLFLPGVVVMLPYLAGFVAFLRLAATTRTKAPFYLYLAAILCGLAILAKGLAGLGLPVIILLAYLSFTWNWRLLRRPGFLRAVLVALLACAVVAVPWHHAMLVRHGAPFWAELYGDNHWRRMVQGRHGDRGSFEYFLRQLGYAIFPWVALAPAALMWAAAGVLGRKQNAAAMSAGVATAPGDAPPGDPQPPPGPGASPDRRRDMFWFGAIWFVSAYAVVALSMTKFHHYILPALPGLAIAIGCFLDEALASGRRRLLLLAALTGLPLLGLVTFDLVRAQKDAQHFVWLFSYDYVNAPQGRPWPSDLDYRKIIAVFAGVFGLGVLAMAVRRAHKAGLVLAGAAAAAFTWFLLDVFMRQVSDRWSQKPLVADYYRQRRSPDERLIAWQMYWRGETFYTQNEIYEGPAEERTVFLGDKNAENLKDYLARKAGRRMYFVVEKTRWNTLGDLLPPAARPSLKVVNDRNNKFYLASVDL